MPDALRLFIPIRKIDIEQRLVYGIATAQQPDRAGEVCDYAGTKPYYEKWSAAASEATGGKSLGNVRAMHSSIAAGKLTDIAYDDDAQTIEVCAKVVDDAEWNKCREGVYTGFSQGGDYVERWKDPDDGLWHYIADPVEISLVDLPCLPSATFSVIKAGGLVEQRHFITTTAAQEAPVFTNDQVAAKARELAKAAGDETKWATFIEAGRAALEKNAAPETPPAQVVAEPVVEIPAAPVAVVKAAAADDEEDDEAKKAVKKDDDEDDEAEMAAKAAAQAELAKAAEGIAELPSGAEIRQVWIGADGKPFAKKDAARAHAATLVEKASPLDSALAGLDAVLTKTAAPEPAPGITDANGLAAAIAAYPGLVKGKQVARRAIVKAAFDLGAESTLPAEIYVPGAKPEGEALAKSVSLYSVASLLNLLACVEAAEEELEYDSIWYGTSVPDELKTRFGALLVEFGDVCAAALDVVLDEMKAEESSEALTRAAAPLALVKAGARHSKADKEALKTAHAALVKLGAECDMDKGAETGPLAKGVVTGDIEKRMGDLETQLGKAVEAIGKSTAAIAERDKRIDELGAEMAKLKATPAPGGAARMSILPDAGDMLAKAQESLDAGNLVGAADAMIKASQRRPMVGLTSIPAQVSQSAPAAAPAA